jgi:hypothetical protein
MAGAVGLARFMVMAIETTKWAVAIVIWFMTLNFALSKKRLEG